MGFPVYLPTLSWIILKKHKIIFTVFITSSNWEHTISFNPSSAKARTHSSSLPSKTMAADASETQGAWASAGLVSELVLPECFIPSTSRVSAQIIILPEHCHYACDKKVKGMTIFHLFQRSYTGFLPKLITDIKFYQKCLLISNDLLQLVLAKGCLIFQQRLQIWY